MENILEKEKGKISPEKFVKLILLFGIISLTIDDIVENKLGNFILSYFVAILVCSLIILVSYVINYKGRKYFNYSVSILICLWFLSSPIKYFLNNDYSGFKFYGEILGGGLVLFAFIFYVINYKRFITD